MTKAKRSNTFPMFKGTQADQCPTCLSVLVLCDEGKVICPHCASKMIRELRLALIVARTSNFSGTKWKLRSQFDNRILNILKGKFYQ